MNLSHVRVFLAVANAEHITHASQELFISQSAVSKTIHALEQETGVQLIERQGRGIVLTPAGRLLQTYASQLFAMEHEMEKAVEALRTGDRGEIFIGASKTTGTYLLPELVSRFRGRYPQVELHIRILNSQEVMQQTLDWQLDFGLVEGEVPTWPPELAVEVFAKDELVLVLAPTHPWALRDAVPPQALQEGVLLLREQGSGTRFIIEQAFARLNMQIQPLLTLPENEIIKEMVIAEIGVAILPFATVQRELKSGALVRIPLSGLDLHRQLRIIRRVNRRLSRAAVTFYHLVHPETQMANGA